MTEARLGATLLGWGLGLGLVFALLLGCASAQRADRALVYTEQGIEAAEQLWDAHYRGRLAYCKARHAPGTDGARECFGPTYEVDARVGAAVHAAVAALREYWHARANGGAPSWADTVRQVRLLLQGLPPEARDYFDRIEGLK